MESSYNRWQNSSLVQPPREKNSDEEMAHYLLNEILLIVGGLNRFNREKITFLEFLQVLRELNMIAPSYEPCNNDQVYDMWAMLCQGNRDLSACLVNYAILLLAVMDIKGQPAAVKRFFESVPYVDASRMTVQTKKRSSHALVVEHPFRKNKEGHFQLTQSEVHRIYKSFQQFRVTRMHLGQIQRKVELYQDRSAPRYPFQPLISDRSRGMHRSDSRRKCSQHHNQSKEKQNIECTFQPNLHRSASRTKDAGLRKSEELYRLSKDREKKLTGQLKQDEEAGKSQDKECSFHPKISSFSKKKSEAVKSIEKSKAEERQIERMKKARMEKELHRAFQKTGTTLTEKMYTKLRADLEKAFKSKPAAAQQEREKRHSKVDLQVEVEQPPRTSPQEAQSPAEENPNKVLMTIEVFVSQGQVHNLVVHQGDNPEQLAREFSRLHSIDWEYLDLDNKMCCQLSKQIETAVRFSLCQIEEESVECSEDY